MQPLLLLTAFAAIPVLDLLSLVKAGSILGFLPTVGLLAAAALLGVLIVRTQRFAAAARIRRSIAERRAPVREVFDSACLFVAGVLLIFPGFASDVVAALLLLPFVRGALFTAIARNLRVEAGALATGPAPFPGRGPVIEGEAEPVGAPGPSPWSAGGASPPPERTGRGAMIVRPDDP